MLPCHGLGTIFKYKSVAIVYYMETIHRGHHFSSAILYDSSKAVKNVVLTRSERQVQQTCKQKNTSMHNIVPRIILFQFQRKCRYNKVLGLQWGGLEEWDYSLVLFPYVTSACLTRSKLLGSKNRQRLKGVMIEGYR